MESSDSEDEDAKKQREIMAQFPEDVPEVYDPEDDDLEEQDQKYNYYYDEDENENEDDRDDAPYNSTTQN